MDLVFGAYGETSSGVKKLLDCMAQSKLQNIGLRKGSPGGNKELSFITGYLRRRIWGAVMKANVSCLLERMVLVSEPGGYWPGWEEEGAGEAGGTQSTVESRGPVDGEDYWTEAVERGRFCEIIRTLCEKIYHI